MICIAVGIGSAIIATSQMTPTYEADATILVEHQLDTGATNFESIQAAERRTRTFSELVTSRPVLNPVIEDLNLAVTSAELENNVSVSHEQQTQLVTISVRDQDPESAATIANAITDRFAEYVQETQAPAIDDVEPDVTEATETITALMESTEDRINELQALGETATAAEQEELARLQNLYEQYELGLALMSQIDDRLAAAEGRLGSQVQLAESAIAPAAPVTPRPMLNAGLAGMMGLIVGFGLVVLLGYLDDKIKVVQDLRELIDQDLLGAVPRQPHFGPIEQIHSGQSLTGEVFQSVRANLEFAMNGRNVKSMLVTSTRQEEGKTTIAANVAAALAQDGKRVILVDADLRRPTVHTIFRAVRNHKGISNLLHIGSTDVESALQSTEIKNLRALTTGPLPRNPAVLLNSPVMKQIARALEASADIVVYDSPPVPISDSLILSRLTDGIVYVVRAGKVRTSELTESMEAISRSGVPFLGVVMNSVSPSSQSTMHVYQHYYASQAGYLEESTDRPRWFDRLLPWRA